MKIKETCRSAAALVLCVALISAISLPAQEPFNRELMKRDLDIMETVLAKILSANQPHLGFWGGQGVSSLYLEKHGILLSVALPSNLWIGHTTDGKDVRIVVRNEDNLLDIRPGKGTSVIPTPASTASREDYVSGLEEKVTQFFGNYASSIGQLKPNQKITVLVDLRSDFPSIRVFEAEASQQNLPEMVQFTARMADLVAFRKGRLSLDQLQDKLSKNEISVNTSEQPEIQIMADILATALHTKRTGFSGNDRAAYIKGLGAVFFLSSDPDEGFDFDFKHGWKRHFEAVEETVIKSDSQKELPMVDEGIKTQLVTLLGSYGHTLKQVDVKEQVIIVTEFAQLVSPRKLIIEARKQDLNQFGRSEISLDELENRIVIQEL